MIPCVKNMYQEIPADKFAIGREEVRQAIGPGPGQLFAAEAAIINNQNRIVHDIRQLEQEDSFVAVAMPVAGAF